MDEAMVPRKNPNTAYRIFDGKATIVLPEQAEVNVLNEVGSLVWERIDGSRTVEQLIDAVVAECDTTREAARHDVMEFLGALRAHGMVI
jgi:coenzyme PQQ synthesis protein D (PqqD)